MSASEAGGFKPERSFRRLDFSFILSARFQRGLLAVLVSCVVSFLAIEYVSRPSLDIKVGDIAEHDVRATQTHEIVDPVATDLRRSEAARSVRPVFDFDADAARRTAKRIGKAFDLGRKGIAADSEPVAVDAEEGDAEPLPDREDPEEAESVKDAIPAVAKSNDPVSEVEKSTDIEAIKAFQSSGATAPDIESVRQADVRRDFLDALGTDVLDVFYQNLVFLRFDPELESMLKGIVSEALESHIISDKGILPNDVDTNGITVMRLSDNRREPETLYDPGSIIDRDESLDKVRELVETTLGNRPQFHKDTVLAVAIGLIQPNFSYNAAETNLRRSDARNTARSVTYQIKKGTMIVRAGDPIDAQKLQTLKGIAQAKEMYRADEMFISVAVLVFIVLLGTYLFAATYIRKFSTSVRDLLILSIILVFVMALSRVAVSVSNALGTYLPSIPFTSYYYAIPIACGVMLARILMNSETALVFAVVSSALAAMLLEYDFFFFIFFFVSSVAAAGGISHTKERVHVLQGGIVAAGANVVMVVAIYLVQTRMLESRMASGSGHLTYDLIFSFVGGIGAAVLALGIVPFFEMFGYVTDYKLLELANLNHPLLKELMLHAPGTYHHSVIVGSLSEAAAQEIGCNALLARVSCYYHDIGKVRKPDYFIENLRNVTENKHDRLQPHLSARIIASHVRDGVEMARQHRLPQAIIDLIPQHHGTALISFFLNKARQEATSGEVVEEKDFRYPGPKPQTREGGILMLADATEASTRSIKQVTAAKIQMNLQRIFQRIITDGQLDECPLTLKDLRVVSDSFLKVLMGIYHNRIEYPAEYRGAEIAGEGTGAVITLEMDSLAAASLLNGEQGRPALRAARQGWTDELANTTTADPVLIEPAIPETSEKKTESGEWHRDRTDDPPPRS